MLSALIKQKGLTQRAYAEKIGMTQRTLSHVLAGTRNPPLHRIELMAQKLSLSGVERESFLDACALTHCPPRIQTLVADLRRRVGDAQ